MKSVHDNRIIGYEVDCQARRVVLHTVTDPSQPPERVDVVFNEVVAYKFEGDNFANVLLSLTEASLDELVRENAALFAENQKYCWPRPWNASTDSVLKHCESLGAKAFNLGSAYGMGGWVIAQSCAVAVVT